MNADTVLAQCLAALASVPLVHAPHRVNQALVQRVQAASDDELCQGPVQRPICAQAVRAGCLLIAGEWDAAHRLVQELDTHDAYYWHGVVHRQEPDWSNAAYWFRRVPAHPAFAELPSMLRGQHDSAEVLTQLRLDGTWDPVAQIEHYRACVTGTCREQEQDLLWLQQREIDALLRYGVRQALSRIS